MLDQIVEDREKKLGELKKAGFNPYPSKTRRSFLISEAIRKFWLFSVLGKTLVLAGRLKSWRDQGKLVFADLEDASGRIQLVVKKDLVKNFELFKSALDVGDFVEAEGRLFKTKTGEKSLEAKELKVLSKSLRPLPSEWYGLKDVEDRFRRRYLDFIFNPESGKKMEVRSRLVAELRELLRREGFMEVETPVLQNLPGGARARPFTTHHNALNEDFYLRISPELYLKRLLVGGFEKVFEIGRNFRNEGIDRDHNPEFTMLELYWAYQDYRGLMAFAEKILERYLDDRPEKIEFAELFKKYGGGNLEDVDGRELEEIFKKKIRPEIVKSAWVLHYPEKIMPLAKLLPGNLHLTESFQLIVGGSEIIKGFSELNDPAVQRRQMEEQEKEYRKGDQEASRLDEDFLEALEYGMPPAAGLGLGIDRLAALLTGSHSVKEVIAFPTLRSKE